MSKVVTMFAIVALCVAFLPAGAAVAAPSVDEIVAKYIEAIGGEAAIKKIKNRKTTGKFSLPGMGMEAPMITITQPPDLWSEVNVEAMGIMIHSGISGDVAWSNNPMEGARILEGAERAGAVRQGAIERFLDWKDHYSGAEVVGEEAVGDSTCHKVVFTPELGDPESVFFDKDSGLILQAIATVQGVSMTATVGEYKEFDGVKIATQTTQEGGPMGEVIIIVDTVEHNVDIEDGKFDLPEEVKALQAE